MSFFPSENKLENLRIKGDLPVSSVASRIFFFLGYLLSLVLLKEKLINIFIELRKLEINFALYNDFIILAIVIPSIAGLLSYYIGHLVQSRFYIRFSLLSFNMRRLFKFQDLNLFNLFLSMFIKILLLLFFIFLSLSLFYYLSSDVLSLLNKDVKYFTDLSFLKMGTLIPIISIVLIIISFFSWLINRYLFMFYNRMSREEIEKELR